MVIGSVKAFHSARSKAALLLSFSIALGGCGGGSTGEASLLGGGQDPDPVVLDFAVAYVKRPVPRDDNGDLMTSDVREPAEFYPGAELFLRDRASPSAAAISVTEGVFPDDVDGNPPLYDIKDLSVSFDGMKLVFAMRAPEDPNLDDDEQPTWNLWVYDRELLELRRVIASDITAEEGQDVAPRFLPDGRIVFSSTRQRRAKAILLDEGKPQFAAFDEDRNDEAFALHVVDEDGSDLQQITFNQSSDLDPAVLDDGRVVFSRWDNVSNINRISLYSVNPDGTGLQLHYGVHSHDTGPDGDTVEFVEAQELPDGRLLAILRPPGNQALMSTVPVAIDTEAFVEHDQPTFANQGLLTDAQELLIAGALSLDESAAVVPGRYAHVTPLFDGTDRLLVAWSQCRLVDDVTDPLNPVFAACTPANLADPNFVEADPLYGIWMYDPGEQTQQPIVVGEEGIAYSDVVIMEPRVAPPVILDGVPGIELDADLVAESMGALHIRSVYDIEGISAVDLPSLADPVLTAADARPARFLRLVKAVSMPDDDLVDLDGTAFGRSQDQLMREILGYAPIEPDGSVTVKVPANVAFWPEILDVDGRRIGPRHRNWLTVRPGETFTCNGCHTPTSEVPHGRLDAEPPSANAGAPVDGSPFPNTAAALFANQGETMAEVYARVMGARTPSVDVVYVDEWTDPIARTPDVSFAYNYDPLIVPPVDRGCITNYNATCRIVINYEQHIHPLWGQPRVDPVDLVTDRTCSSCHGPVDAAGMAQVPADQLDLGDGASADEADHFKSYRELLFNDNQQIVDNGALIDELVPVFDGNGNQVFETDANGDLILDANGDPIPVLVPIGLTPPLSVAGANFSPRFFSRFAPGGTHDGWLTPHELRLISEWIDIGGQYYNDPFAVPQ
ncbi:MAG: hypothetical protein RIC56_23005 [Pseudomonadales bacterium]